MIKVINVVGARPNFIKIAPLIREMNRRGDMQPLLVHTGQHYDVRMAGQFFEDLGIPKPTDSGGIQEETTALGIPCLTIRENTERPVTITHGTNILVGCAPKRIVEEARKVLEHPRVHTAVPPLWDGRASERIVEVLHAQLSAPNLRHVC